MKIKKISIYCFYIAYALLIFETMFSRLNVLENYKRLFLYFELLLLLFSFVFSLQKDLKAMPIKKLLFYFLSLFIVVLSYKHTNSATFLMIILFVLSSSEIEFNKFIKFDMKYKIIMLLVMIFFIKIGLIDNLQTTRANGISRNTMGFYSPNTMGIYLLNICCDYAFLNKEKFNIKCVILIVLIAIINYLLTDSRTSTLCLFLLAFFLLLRNKINLKYLFLVPFIFSILSFYFVYLFSINNSIFLEINSMLSNRLFCGLKFYEEYGINFFGNQFRIVTDWIGFTYVLDNAYLNVFIHHGFVLAASSLIALNIFCKKIKHYNNIIKIIFLIYFISGIFESNLFSIVYNPFLIYVSQVLLYNSKLINKNIQKL